jgi:tRNA(fMet)-specific endonuclease VapC
LDTNVVSEPPRPFPNPGVVQRLREHKGKVAIATVVWHELLFGLDRLPDSHRKRALETYLRQIVEATMPILSYDRAAAEWHARQRAKLTAIGRTPSFQDGQIAAIARSNNLILVTANRSHFEIFESLSIENWGE